MTVKTEYFRSKNILITGGAGYIGYNIIRLLKDTDCRIVCLDPAQPPVFPGSRATIEHAAEDIRDMAIWPARLKGIDVVFHLAAQTSVYRANSEPLADIEINVLPELNMLETCRREGYKPAIILSSSVTVFGLPDRLPVDETRRDSPVSMYDLHKIAAENYLAFYCQQGAVSGASLRLANVYGPGPKSGSADRGILNAMVRKALNREDLSLYGSGEFIRDYVYVEDVAAAFLLAAAKADRLSGERFIIGTGQGRTLAEAFKTVAGKASLKRGCHVSVVSVPPPPGLSSIENRNFIADFGKFHRATGWTPAWDFNRGVDATIEHYLDECGGAE